MLRGPVKNDRGSSRKDAGSSRRDQKYFSKTAGMTHGINLRKAPMRGGYRI